MEHLLEIGDQIFTYRSLSMWPYHDIIYTITRVTKTVAYGEYKGEVMKFNRKVLYGVVLPKSYKKKEEISYRLGKRFNQIHNQ